MVSSPRPGWLAPPCPILPPWGAGVEEVSSYGCSGTQLARGEASGEAVDEDALRTEGFEETDGLQAAGWRCNLLPSAGWRCN